MSAVFQSQPGGNKRYLEEDVQKTSKRVRTKKEHDTYGAEELLGHLLGVRITLPKHTQPIQARIAALAQLVEAHGPIDFATLHRNMVQREHGLAEIYITLATTEFPKKDSDYLWVGVEILTQIDGSYIVQIREYSYEDPTPYNGLVAEIACNTQGQRTGIRRFEAGKALSETAGIQIINALFPPAPVDIRSENLNALVNAFSKQEWVDPGPGTSIASRLHSLSEHIKGALHVPASRFEALKALATRYPSTTKPGLNVWNLYITLPLVEEASADKDYLWLSLIIEEPRKDYWSSMIDREALPGADTKTYHRIRLWEYAYSEHGGKELPLLDLRCDKGMQVVELVKIQAGKMIRGTQGMVLYDLLAKGAQELLVDAANVSVQVPGRSQPCTVNLNILGNLRSGKSWYEAKGFKVIACAKLMVEDGTYALYQSPIYYKAAALFLRTYPLKTLLQTHLKGAKTKSLLKQVMLRQLESAETASLGDLVSACFAAQCKATKSQQDTKDYTWVYEQLCTAQGAVTDKRYTLALQIIEQHMLFGQDAKSDAQESSRPELEQVWTCLTSKCQDWSEVTQAIDENGYPNTLDVYQSS
jgi:hypothetical protein